MRRINNIFNINKLLDFLRPSGSASTPPHERFDRFVPKMVDHLDGVFDLARQRRASRHARGGGGRD
jgi:hypothetical protein